MDQISAGRVPVASTVVFYVRDATAVAGANGANSDGLARVEALLPASGSLGPLFYAFGLISRDELDAGRRRACTLFVAPSLQPACTQL